MTRRVRVNPRVRVWSVRNSEYGSGTGNIMGYGQGSTNAVPADLYHQYIQTLQKINKATNKNGLGAIEPRQRPNRSPANKQPTQTSSHPCIHSFTLPSRHPFPPLHRLAHSPHYSDMAHSQIEPSIIKLSTQSFNQWSSGINAAYGARGHGSRPVYYLPCSDLGQVVNLSIVCSLDKRLSGCQRLIKTSVKPA